MTRKWLLSHPRKVRFYLANKIVSAQSANLKEAQRLIIIRTIYTRLTHLVKVYLSQGERSHLKTQMLRVKVVNLEARLKRKLKLLRRDLPLISRKFMTQIKMNEVLTELYHPMVATSMQTVTLWVMTKMMMVRLMRLYDKNSPRGAILASLSVKSPKLRQILPLISSRRFFRNLKDYLDKSNSTRYA